MYFAFAGKSRTFETKMTALYIEKFSRNIHKFINYLITFSYYYVKKNGDDL